MQDPKDIEDSYRKTVDPWGYKKSPEDAKRKRKILDVIYSFNENFQRALDIGAGEGFITQHLPAKKLYGYEVSDTAASRFPINVQRVTEPEGDYDLVLASGVFYSHYDFRKFIKIIKKHASHVFVTSNIKSWVVKDLDQFKEFQVHEEEFPYHEYVQNLRVYNFKK